jgi:hypothetical protein
MRASLKDRHDEVPIAETVRLRGKDRPMHPVIVEAAETWPAVVAGLVSGLGRP